MTFIIIILVVVAIALFLLKGARYSKKLEYQEKRLNEKCDAYIRSNIQTEDCVDTNYLLDHVGRFIFRLNDYSYYPETRNKAPYIFLNRLHELDYISIKQLIEIKEKYQNISVSLDKMMNQR